VRTAASALYAFCRVADNAVDEEEPRSGMEVTPEASTRGAVEQLEGRLAAVYGEGPLDGPVDRAFRSVVREHGIPKSVPAALLEGLRWDEQGRRYAELADLYDYAVRVGSTVGVMMTLTMGRREESTLADAAELGMAMQLTNICRDVGEDARRGRVYLPFERLRESGVDVESWLARPRFEPGIADTVGWLLNDADRLYARSWQGISRLPAASQPAIRAAALLYAEIGQEIRKAGLDSVDRRAWTGGGTKLSILGRALVSSRPPAGSFPGRVRTDGPAGNIVPPSGRERDPARAAAAELVSSAANFGAPAGYDERP
jgi:phytoene synthase